MTHAWFRSTVLACFTCGFALGCGGGAPPAAAPPAAQPETGAAKPQASAAETPAPAPTPPASASPAAGSASPSAAPEEPKPEEPVVTRTLSDRVFAARVAYMLNYPASGAKDAADKKCSAKYPDPAAKAECMDKEREKFT